VRAQRLCTGGARQVIGQDVRASSDDAIAMGRATARRVATESGVSSLNSGGWFDALVNVFEYQIVCWPGVERPATPPFEIAAGDVRDV
jgi:hypothetical protein